MKRYLLLGAALVLVVIGARIVKGMQESADPPAPSPPPRSMAGAKATRMRADLNPIPIVADPLAAGEYRLQGLVLGAGDLPVEGATVTLEAAPPRIARTDRGGSFAFESLPPGLYLLEARLGGLVAGPITAALREGSGPVTLRLRSAAAVEVEVVDAKTRQGLPGAALELRGESVLAASAGAGGKARFEGVRPGKYVLKAAAPGHAPALKSVAVPDSSELERVSIELGTGAAASGEVRDDRGRPVTGIPVVAELASTLVSLADARQDGVHTDDRGRWRFPALAAGTYRFVASDAAHAPGSSPLTALDGVKDRGDILIQLGAGARLAGRVVTRSGDPVAFALVRAAVNEGALGQPLARQTQCDQRGEFALGGMPRKLVDVVAVHETATSATHKIDLRDEPERTGLTLALDLDGTIPGIVVGSSSQPVAEAVVLAEPLRLSAHSRAEVTLRGKIVATADEAGKFVLRGLAPGGVYMLRAAPPATSPDRHTSWLRPPVKAEASGKEVVLRLESDGRVKGQVRREEGGVPDIFSVAVGGAGGFTGLGGNGDFALRDVPPGNHSLTVSGPSFVTKIVQNVEVKPDQETDVGPITVTSGRRITGRVLRGDATPVAGAMVTASKAMTSGGIVVGPAGAALMDVRQAVSREDGSYSIDGMSIVPLSLGAEHPTEGRSAFVPVATGVQEVKADLVLKASGVLSGRITQRGQPVEGALVLATAKGAPAGGSGVTTGTDGSYQFDSLTPGPYTVMAVVDAGGGQNVKQDSAVVQAGQTVRLDIDLPQGTVTVAVHLTFVGSVPTAPVIVILAKANPTETPGGPAPTPDFQTQTIAPNEVAKFANVVPGSYRACAGVAAASSDGGTLPKGTKMGCKFTTFGPTPPIHDVSVTVPAAAPAP